jgi:hypothetical protein
MKWSAPSGSEWRGRDRTYHVATPRNIDHTQHQRSACSRTEPRNSYCSDAPAGGGGSCDQSTDQSAVTKGETTNQERDTSGSLRERDRSSGSSSPVRGGEVINHRSEHSADEGVQGSLTDLFYVTHSENK